MKELSNKTLAILVIVSIAATLISIVWIPSGGVSVLGSATNTTSGTANLTIQSTVQIILTTDSVDFGRGFVNSSADFCALDSTNTTPKSSACVGFDSPAISPAFVVQNNGNNNVTLTINGTFANPRAFMCDPLNGQQNCSIAGASPEYNWSIYNSSGCAGGGTLAYNHTLNTSSQQVCSNFNHLLFSPISVSLWLKIPRDSKSGQLKDNITFTATG